METLYFGLCSPLHDRSSERYDQRISHDGRLDFRVDILPFCRIICVHAALLKGIQLGTAELRILSATLTFGVKVRDQSGIWFGELVRMNEAFTLLPA